MAGRAPSWDYNQDDRSLYSAAGFAQTLGSDGVLTVLLTGVKKPYSEPDSFTYPTWYTLTPAGADETIGGRDVCSG